jgi:hypothetical protein
MFASFLDPFPELTQLDESVSKFTVANDRDVTSRTEVYQGPSFRQFAEAQPATLQAVLADLRTPVTNHLSAKRATVALGGVLRKELQRLKPLNADIRERKKRHSAIEASHDKANKAAAAAQDKHEKLTARSAAAPETRKAEIEADTLKTRLSSAEEEKQKSEAEFKQSEIIYKKQFFEILLTGIGGFATGRKEQVSLQLASAGEIQECAKRMEPCDDPGVERLKAELAELRETDY